MIIPITFLKKIDYIAGPLLLRLAAYGKYKSKLLSPYSIKQKAKHEVQQSKVQTEKPKPKIKIKHNAGYPIYSIKHNTEYEINRILIIRPGGIGDAVLLIPSLKLLKEILPGVSIDILCEPRNRGVFFRSPFVDRIFNYRNFMDLMRIKKNYYEVVVDTEQSHFLSAVLISGLSLSSVTDLVVGFAVNGRESVYDVSVEYHHDQYEMDSFFRLFKAVIKGWPEKPFLDPPYFFTSSKEAAKVSALLCKIIRPVICIFPGASIKQRRWSVTSWGKLVEQLWENGFQPVLLGASNEQELNLEIVRHADCRVLNFCRKLTLTETSLLFKRSMLLISTDSGILHIGVLSDIPTVSLFGPGIAKKWAPKGDKHIVLNKNLSCSPCTCFGETPPCSIGARCMQTITVNDVFNAASKLLEKQHIT